VLHHFILFALRAEQDDLGILSDFDGVSRRPAGQVAAAEILGPFAFAGHREFDLQHKPQCGDQQISLSSLTENDALSVPTPGETYSPLIAPHSAALPKFVLRGPRPRRIDPDGDVLLRYAHRGVARLWWQARKSRLTFD
jgi:hypothetical protein